MIAERLGPIAVQSGIVFLILWLLFRFFPSISPNVRAWVWRLAFLKPLVALLPLTTVALPLLPAPSGVGVVSSTTIVLSDARAVVVPAIAHEPRPSLDLVGVTWAFGVATFLVIGLVAEIRTRRIVARASLVTEGAAWDSLRRWLARAGVRRGVELRVSDEIDSAMVVGGWRPVVLLPVRIPSPDADLMLAHEVAHLARRDLAWSMAIWAVQAMFFFNPLVWVAARCARQAHESATDQYAAELTATPIPVYAGMLLRSVITGRAISTPGTLTMSESYRTLHQRLNAMKYFDARPTKLRAFASGVLVLGAVCLTPHYLLAAGVPQSKGKPSANLTLKLTKADARQALLTLFMKGRKSFTIQPDVQGTVTLNLTNVTFETALKNIVGQIQADYKFEKGVYMVYSKRPGSLGTRPSTLGNVRSDEKAIQMLLAPPFSTGVKKNGDVYTFGFQSIEVREGLKELFQKAGESYRIDPNVEGAVTLSVQNVTLETALDNMTRQVDAVWRRDGATVIVEKTPGKAINLSSDGRYDLRLDRCDVREAVRLLFRHASVSYTIAPDLQGTVSSNVSGVTLEAALGEILRQVDGTFRSDAGVYQIGRKSKG